MRNQLLIGLLLVPAFATSCANTDETRHAAESAAVPNAPKLVFEVEGMT
ncbi:MAG: hypothetical protein R3F49_07630 [Planctomycetota bacterium]